MRALILESPGRLKLADVAAQAGPGPGEALVRVHRAGVCGTDIHAFAGRQPFFSYPRLIGHELGVEVLALGEPLDGASDAGLAVGNKCAVEPYLNCGHCIACRRGRGNCCERLQVLGVHRDGGFREELVVPAVKLHNSDKLSYESLALVETLGIGAHAVARAGLERGEHTLVIGAGPIGLGVMQFARRAGAEVVALDANDERLRFCREQWGVPGTLRPGDTVHEELRALCGGDLPTAVFDATGNPASMRAAFDFVAPSGRLVFVGLFNGDAGFHDPDFHRKEMTLLATRNALPQDFRNIIGWIEAGEIDTSAWITHRAGIGQAAEIFESWTLPETRVLKAMIEVGETGAAN